jgi:hypothetical protein
MVDTRSSKRDARDDEAAVGELGNSESRDAAVVQTTETSDDANDVEGSADEGTSLRSGEQPLKNGRAEELRRSRMEASRLNENLLHEDEIPKPSTKAQARGARGPEVGDVAATKSQAMITIKTFAEGQRRYVTVYTKAWGYNPLCRVGCCKGRRRLACTCL